MHFRGLTIAALFVGAASAHAVVLDFQSLQIIDANVHVWGQTYSEDGFDFTKSGTTNQFGTFGTLEARYPGSTALFNDEVNSTIKLVQTGGGAFNALTIDLDSLNTPQATPVSFTGTRADLSTVTQTFTTNATLGLQTFSFTGFTNIVKLEWVQASPFHQFDNIVVNAVPEPASMAALGLGVLALVRRRRAAKK